MPLKKYREKKARELEEYRGKKARKLKEYRDKKARELKEYRGKKARELKEYRGKKRFGMEEYRGKKARELEEYRDKKARERKAYEGYGDRDPVGNDKFELETLGPTVAESGLNNLGMYPMDAPKNGSFGTPARQNFEGMKKGGKVNKKKSYSRGGKVRGAGKASQGVRPAKMVKMKGS